MIKLTLPIAPVAWQRVQRTRHGVTFVPPKTRAFKAAVGVSASTQLVLPEPLVGPLSLSLRFVLTPPKRPKHKEPIVRPDLDNYVKGVMDALNGIVWADDSQIVETRARKLYAMDGSPARIELEVSELDAAPPQRSEG